jgi:hypothetical protein
MRKKHQNSEEPPFDRPEHGVRLERRNEGKQLRASALRFLPETLPAARKTGLVSILTNCFHKLM